MPINFPQGFYEAGVFLGLDQALKSVMPAVSERLKKRVEERQNYQELARQFIRQNVREPYRTYLLNRVAQAVKDKWEHPFWEDRIHDAFATVYAAGEAIKDENERMRWRLQAFEDFGRTAAHPDTFKAEIESIESKKFITWLLVTRKLGIDVWEFLKNDAWPEVKDFFDRHPSIKGETISIWQALQAEVYEYGGAYDASAEILEPGSYRARIRDWMRADTERMNQEYAERLARGDEEVFTTNRGNHEIRHHRVRAKGWLIVVGLLVMWFIVSGIIGWFAS